MKKGGTAHAVPPSEVSPNRTYSIHNALVMMRG